MEKLEQERNSVLHTLTYAESTERGISAFYFNTCCKKIFYIYFIEELVGIIYRKNAFSIASLFCNSIMFMLGMSSTCMFINFGLLVGCWLSLALHFSFRTKNKRVKALRGSTSISQSNKDKYLACMSILYMSAEESLSEPESGRHVGNSSGSDGDLPNRKSLCVRPPL